MNIRAKYIAAGLFACAALSFAGVSCMQFFAEDDRYYIDMSKVDLVQIREPEKGAVTAVIKTTAGDIKAVIYTDKAPNAANRFIKLAESGYYDNTYVYDSQDGVYFSAGSSDKNGSTDKSRPDGTDDVEMELCDDLWPFRGALCCVSSGLSGSWWDRLNGNMKLMNGRNFLVINSVDFTDSYKKELLEANDSKTLAQKFIAYHGVPNMSRQITVFGQTYDGFDVIDKLTALETESAVKGVRKPVEDIMIKSVEIGTYGDSDKWTMPEYPTESLTEADSVQETENKD